MLSNLSQINHLTDADMYEYTTINISPKFAEEDKGVCKHIISLVDKHVKHSGFYKGISHDSARRLIAKLPLPRGSMVNVNGLTPSLGVKGAQDDDVTYINTLAGPKELKSVNLARCLRGGDPEYDPAPISSIFYLIVTAHASHHGICALTSYAYYDPKKNTGAQKYTGIAVVNFCVRVPNSKCEHVHEQVPREHLSDALIGFTRQSRGATPQQFFCKMRVTTTYLGYGQGTCIKRTVIKTDEFGKETVEQYFKRSLCATPTPCLSLYSETRRSVISFLPRCVKFVPGYIFAGHLDRGPHCGNRFAHPAQLPRLVILVLEDGDLFQ